MNQPLLATRNVSNWKEVKTWFDQHSRTGASRSDMQELECHLEEATVAAELLDEIMGMGRATSFQGVRERTRKIERLAIQLEPV